MTDTIDQKAKEAYAQYLGLESAEELSDSSLAIWVCDDCEVRVPVSVSDPYAYGPVFCPSCGQICEQE
ncbi:MAG: hypothetical protein HQRvContig03_39 [Haloquadratum phage sp.]|nr:MAG: hypothetical protein HQRvContig03_39 [Haloquadratum phage sp.]